MPATDPGPLPPELALDDEPLTPEELGSLDTAMRSADGDPQAVLLDPSDPAAPAAANLVPARVRAWEISDDGAAEWAMRHVARIDGELRTLGDQRDDWQARIDLWFHQRADSILRRRSFFVAHLIGYGAARREKDPKGPKTLGLPSGRITSSDRQATVRVTDDEKVAAWLKARGILEDEEGADIVATTTKVYAVPLRRVLKPAGDGLVIVPTGEPLKPDEIPDGLEIEPAHTDYDVKPVIG